MKHTTVEWCQEANTWDVVAWTVDAEQALRKIGYGDIVENGKCLFPFSERQSALRVSKEINEVLERDNA